jgi:hypothetical protein
MTTVGNTATITSNSDFNANDLNIPQFVGDGINIYQVIEISASAFDGCIGLTGNLTIPNSVETIGYRAFSNCRLNGTLSIGAGVKQI